MTPRLLSLLASAGVVLAGGLTTDLAAASSPSRAKDPRMLPAVQKALAKGDPCKAVKILGKVHSDPALALQRKLFLKHAARHDYCGLPQPTVTVSRSLKARSRVAPLADGRVRPVARLNKTEFVENELIVSGAAALKRLRNRYEVTVLRTNRAGQKLVRIDTRGADTARLGANLRKLEPAGRGRFKVSSTRAHRLLAVAADAAAHGDKIGLNFTTQSHDVIDRFTSEASTGPQGWNADAYTWWYNDNAGPVNMNTGGAWRALRMAGKDTNRVKVSVIDGGFANNGDMSPALAGADNSTNPMACGGGASCPWHGTNVASALGALIDNGAGAAGSGGQVADVQMLTTGATFDAIDQIEAAIENDSRVINMSFGSSTDAIVSFASIPFEDATQEADENGIVVVASAGNDGDDVDAEDCFAVCWEEEWIAPCENDGVLCVGGIQQSGWRHANSNYGKEWCEDAKCDVELFAPMSMWVGPDPANPQPRQVSGTSFSAPYVAGLAAMIFAANPALNDDEVEALLLDYADSSPDKNVGRIADAWDSVRHALPKDIAPLVQILSPSAGSSAPYGAFNTVRLLARGVGLEESECCTFSWTSDKDGTLGAGGDLTVTLATPGTHTITVTAKDTKGLTTSASVVVEATNVAPTMSIDSPAAGAELTRGQTYKFKGSGRDVNDFGGIPCEAMTWSARDAGGDWSTFGTGCQPEANFGAAGVKTIRLVGKDAVGATDTVYHNVTVVQPGADSPPAATILTPDDNISVRPDKPVALRAAVSDADGDTITGVWTLKNGNKTTVLGAGLERSWTPSDDVGFECGGDNVTIEFTATDNDGSTTDSISVHVDYPVC